MSKKELLIACMAITTIGIILWLSVPTGQTFKPQGVPVSPLTIGSAIEPTRTPVPTAVNLLTNPGFEPPFTNSGRAEWWTANGWRAFAQDVPPCKPLTPGCELPCPENCIKVTGSAVISKTDGLVRIEPVTLSVGIPSTLTFSTYSITPLQALELYTFLNPAVITVTSATTITGTLKVFPGYSKYELELDGWTVGESQLFSLQVVPWITSTLHFEVSYFAGSQVGGWYYGQYENFIPTRFTQTVQIVNSRKCVSDTGCYWASPEFGEANTPQRVLSGVSSQKWFTFGRMGQGGVSQTVEITRAGTYYAGVNVQGWQCLDYLTCCHNGYCISDKPFETNFQVCIDDKCSDEVQQFDTFALIGISKYLEQGQHIVSIQSGMRFDYARQNNDSYIDQARLVRLGYVQYLPLVRQEQTE